MKKKSLMKTGLAGILLASMVLTGCGSAFAAEETEPYFEDDTAVIVENDEEDPALPADESDSLSQNENAAPEGLDLASLGLVEEIGEEVSADMDASSIINGNATTLELNAEGQCVPGQTKVYKFTSNETKLYCISSSYTSVDDDDDDMDPYVRLYDQNGGLLATDDDGGVGLNFSLVFRMVEGTTYYILPGTYDEVVTADSYKFSISYFEADDNAEEISLEPENSSKTINASEEKVFYYQAEADAVVEISVASTQDFKNYYLKLADYDVNYHEGFSSDDEGDADDEDDEGNGLPKRLLIEKGHTMWFTLYGYNSDEDNATLTLSLTEVDVDEADEEEINGYRYSGSAVETVTLLPLSPYSQTVAKNAQVQLKVGWTVPGNNPPYFVWYINGKKQSVNRDTLTFLADGKNADYSTDGVEDDYSYYVEVYMYSDHTQTEYYEECEFEVYLSSETHTHRFGAWVNDRAANALVAGSRHRVCSGCGFRETQAIPKLGAFIQLNVSGTLPMKTKQKFNKITATKMQAGDRIASWTSSNPAVVTVDAAGGLKAGKKAGKATITATTAAGASASFNVNVKKAKVKTKKIYVASKSVTLSKGKTFDLMTQISPITSQEKISYSSSDKKVAKVSKNGVITGKKKGKATITVKSGKKKVKVKVKVN